MSAENYRSATKSHDPGWNDPPKLSYSPGMPSGQSTKLNLNKRVAFPVAGTATLSNQPPPPPTIGSSTLPQFIPASSSAIADSPQHANPSASSLPPMPTSTGMPPRSAQIEKPISNTTAETILPTNLEMKDFVQKTLGEFLTKVDNSRQPEIQKRLDLMIKAWSEGKLSDGLINKLYRLANALNDRKTVDANEIHRSIIVENGKECVQWAPALRQLIQVIPKPEETISDIHNVDTMEPIMKPL